MTSTQAPHAPHAPQNPLLDFARKPAPGCLPPFPAIAAEQVVPAIRALLADIEDRLPDLERAIAPTWQSAIDDVATLMEPLERAWGVVSHLMGTKNSPALREAQQTVQPEVVRASLRLSQSEPWYRALVALRDGPEFARLPKARQRILDKKILEMKLSGIALPPAERAAFNKLEEELSELSTRFSNHVLDATKAFSLVVTDAADVDGLPQSARELLAASARQAGSADATADKGPWRVTLDFPAFDPVMRFAKSAALRERVYRAYVARASELDGVDGDGPDKRGAFDNRALIDRILALRIEKAKLLGFSTFAALSLATKMAPSVPEVEKLLEELRQVARPVAEEELAELERFAGHRVQHWDIGYYAERLKEQRFAYSEEELRPYFPLPRVLDGLFHLVDKLFGIHVVDATAEAPRWHDDVRFFRIKDKTGADVAAFFLDPYARPAEKRGGAWMDDCVARRRTASGLRLPVAYLVCNQSPPVNGKPSLMTFREVETLFHEFGHGLQHMLTTVDDIDASGIRGVEWDAVELPSQFMENWCTHKPTLLGMSKHVDTGASLPDELFEKVKAQKTYRAASMMMRQLHFAFVDLELHQRFTPGGGQTVFDVNRRVAEKTAVLAPLAEDRFLCSFTHIFSGGYAAGYYSYKWAEILSADAFGAFEDAGLDDDATVAAVGKRFRDTVLSLGGSVHPLDVFSAFRGRAPTPDALLRHAGLAKRAA